VVARTVMVALTVTGKIEVTEVIVIADKVDGIEIFLITVV
jgi:hypothetical protein